MRCTERLRQIRRNERTTASSGLHSCIGIRVREAVLPYDYRETNERENLESTDILETLLSLATSRNGADLILSPSYVPVFVKLLESEIDYSVHLYTILNAALQNVSSQIKSETVLKQLAELYMTTKKIAIINDLTSFLTSQFEISPPPRATHLSLYRGIKKLMMSKIEDSIRTKTIIFLSLLLTMIGPAFLFHPPVSETNAKQLALLTIKLATVGVQMALSKTSDSTTTDQRRFIAEMDILHVTTAWLLTAEDDAIKIGNEKPTPEEIIKIQESLSSAAHDIALFLRVKYDDIRGTGHTSFDSMIGPVVRAAMKFVGGWLEEGGSGHDEESLGLLEVFVGLCLTGDIDIITWSMRGIKGIILYSENGEEELLVTKGQWVLSLEFIIENLSEEVAEETMIMIREVCSVFRIMVESQPLLVAEQAIRSFPARVLERFTTDRVDEVTWEARTNAALLGLEILLKMADDVQLLDLQMKELLRRWLIRIRKLTQVQRQQDTKEDLEFLAAALQNLNI